MMTKEEIAAFWKLGVALKPILDEDRENVPLTPEGEQALDEYFRLKRMMRQEMDEAREGDESSSQQPQESADSHELAVKTAYDLLADTVEKVISLYKNTLNDASPKEEIEKCQKHSIAMIDALHLIGVELFAKPKIQQPQKS